MRVKAKICGHDMYISEFSVDKIEFMLKLKHLGIDHKKYLEYEEEFKAHSFSHAPSAVEKEKFLEYVRDGIKLYNTKLKNDFTVEKLEKIKEVLDFSTCTFTDEKNNEKDYVIYYNKIFGTYMLKYVLWKDAVFIEDDVLIRASTWTSFVSQFITFFKEVEDEL